MTYIPYTYYRNTTERRAFLLIDCPTELTPWFGRIRLVEWGGKKDQVISMPVETFEALINKGLMQEFNPKYQDD